MAFSQQRLVKAGLVCKIRRAKIKSKIKNPTAEWKLQHGDWIMEAQTGKSDSLVKKLTNDEKNRYDLVLQRRSKIAGKA